MSEYPTKLAEIVDELKSITDRRERAEMLIEIADRFPDYRVPATIASKPYPEEHRVPACESEAFVWAEEQEDGSLRYYFDVLNPQGLSAMAMVVIIAETLQGEPTEVITSISGDVVFQIFGKEVSMGKGAGLIGILNMVQAFAKRHANAKG